MMSYASDGGSAGPHYDNYDVFIIQGKGQRRWQIGAFCDEQTQLLDNTDLRLLADFEPEHEYLMECGDVLYLPPGRAHYGVSVGESTSFSIGFRAPRISDLLARWLDNRLSQLDDDWLFRDPGREPATRPGEISAHDLLRARQQLMAALDDEDPRWFGEAVTATATSGEDLASAIHLTHASIGSVRRLPDSRLAWMQREGELLVFAQGNCYSAPLAMLPIIETLCGDGALDVRSAQHLHDGVFTLLNWLLDEGAIERDD
jgi:50S ribosomal protein L16 3-hydroxylase